MREEFEDGVRVWCEHGVDGEVGAKEERGGVGDRGCDERVEDCREKDGCWADVGGEGSQLGC